MRESGPMAYRCSLGWRGVVSYADRTRIHGPDPKIAFPAIAQLKMLAEISISVPQKQDLCSAPGPSQNSSLSPKLHRQALSCKRFLMAVVHSLECRNGSLFDISCGNLSIYVYNIYIYIYIYI